MARKYRSRRKTKRRRRSSKRKTLRRKSRKTRKTRKRRGGKKLDMFRLNMDIDNDLGHAKKSLAQDGDLSLQFFSNPTRLQKRLNNYPQSPPVKKNMFGRIKKEATKAAQASYQKGLQNQKAKLETILKGVFEAEKRVKESGEQLPPEYMTGNPVTTDAVLKALDQTHKRLGIQNNLRSEVKKWRETN